MKLRGNHFPIQDEEDVHRAHFLDVLLLHAVQPKDLGIALLVGLVLGQEGGGVVAAGLRHAGAPPHRPDILGFYINLHRFQAGFVVGPGRGGDDNKQVLIPRMHPQDGVGADDEGTDIQGGAVLPGDPVLVNLHQLLYPLDAKLFVNGGDGHPLVGTVEAGKILVRAEQEDVPLLAVIGLHPLKNGLAIVQAEGRRGEGQLPVGDDAGVVPALAGLIVHDEHMVAKDPPEAQLLARGRLGLGGLGKPYSDLHLSLSFPT